MKNILLPTDFSGNSLNAIDYGLEFYKGTACHFFILNIQKTSGYTTSDLMAAPANSTVHQSVMQSGKKQLKTLVKDLSHRYENEDFKFESLVDYDVFTDAINQVAKTKQIDLIIMGSNGATGAKEVIFGSNTLNVIRQVHYPLLIVPEGCVFKKLKNVMYTFTNEEEHLLKAFEPLHEIVTMQNTILRILEIQNEGDLESKLSSRKAELNKYFNDVNHSFHKISGVPVTSAIESFVQIMNIDLNALFIKKKSFFERILHGSNTSKISYGTLVPLLILR